MSSVVVPENCVGPPSMGHGGYVGGLLAREIDGAAQITLRQPTPVGVELEIVDCGGDRLELRHGDELLVEATPGDLDLSVPTPPSIDEARAAEAGSPSHWDERGVHPICFGCGLARDDDEGLEIAVGPVTVDGVDQVAAVWRPRADQADADGVVDRQWVLAALDCPGAMAYIADGTRAGLLGRIIFEQFAPVPVETDLVVTGWQIGVDGRKMLAGTALADADGTILAAAKATWFAFT
ncbi:hypothetical protein [Actinospongicola halichondriae]|uniref:hypothetical protein n=1 Tax=Actinospongicola halichondriae TaxID=3236844 RepID=UPI003D54A628